LQCVGVCCSVLQCVDITLHIMCKQYHFTCTWWRRIIACLKVQVIFRKRATTYVSCVVCVAVCCSRIHTLSPIILGEVTLRIKNDHICDMT